MLMNLIFFLMYKKNILNLVFSYHGELKKQILNEKRKVYSK
jgi:hypothetical protein